MRQSSDGLELAQEHRRAYSLPGHNPPPSQAELALVDPRSELRLTLSGAGAFSNLSAGIGPIVVARQTLYQLIPPKNPADYGDYVATSGWRLFDSANQRQLLLEGSGEPTLSPDGLWIAWKTAEDVTIIGVDGASEHTSVGDAFVWGADGRYAIRSDNGFRIVDADGSEAVALPSRSGRRLAWSPIQDRVLVEYACDGDERYRQEVFDGTSVTFATECDAREFQLWSPDGSAFAVSEPNEETATAGFRVIPLAGAPTSWHEGAVCAFRPDGLPG